MQEVPSSQHQISGSSALWSVDLKLTHLDWNPETTLIHFQGKHPTMCELDYIILQCEIQRAPKAKAAVDIGDLCLVEDLASAHWYRGRVQNRKEDLFDVFLIDYGNILSVGAANISACSDDLFSLHPKIVCGFLSSVLISQSCCTSAVEQYFSNLVGKNVTGYAQAVLPYKVLILEVPEINNELVLHGFGRHVDTDTFLFLVEMLTEIPPKQGTEPTPDPLIKNPSGREELSALQAYRDLLSFQGPQLRCGTQATVCVTAAASAQHFYCRICGMEQDLQEISKKLAAVYEGRTRETNHGVQENLGLLCAVKGKDWGWHRGFLPFLPDKSRIRVFFIDYGFFECVDIEDVHRLPDGFDSIPFMAFPCSLGDVDEEVKARQLSFLKSGLLGSVLDVEIRDFEEKEHLYTVTINNPEGKAVEKAEPILKTKRDFAAEDLTSHNSYLYLETIIRETFLKTLGIEEMTEGAAFVGYVTFAQNPERFWIRTQNRNDEFEELMSNMVDHFREVKMDDDVLVNPQLGTLCCAMYEEDLHFYRALVISQLLHGCEVLFIDFGNIEKVPHNLIKKIPRALADPPAFAFCCSLDNVIPLDDVWTTTMCESFRKTVSGKALRVQVVQMRKSTFVVDLYEMGDGAQSIAEFISSKHDGFWSSVPNKPAADTDTECQRHGEVSDPPEEKQEVEVSEEQEDKTCKNTGKAAFKSLNIKPGCQLAVCCSCVASPSDFWCLSFDRARALAKLMTKMQLYYSTHTVPLLPEDSCCVVKSPRDEVWYRAAITDRQQARCVLALVDYGYSVQMEEHHLQGILPEFLHLERQAFRCSLSRLIEPAEPVSVGGWSSKVCKLLKELLHDKNSLRCIVVSQWNIKNRGSCNVVELYSNKYQQSITSFLLEQGLAREATFSILPMSSEFPESFVYSSFDLGPGSKEEVFVTHIINQGEIYCHLERNIDVIEKLEMKIVEETRKRTPGDSDAAVRNLCLAKYFDGLWYRGFVHAVQSAVHLGVFFVDYGNSVISEKSNVARISGGCADLLHTPMQALRFRLASVPREELYADVSQWLSETVLHRQLTARVLAPMEDGSFDVELFDGDASINEKVRELVASLLPKTKPLLSLPGQNKTNLGPLSTGTTSQTQRGGGVCAMERPEEERSVPAEPQETPEEPQASLHAGGESVPELVGKTDIPQLSSLPDIEVTEGFRTSCFMSHIDSLSSFFLQRADDEPAILKMVEDLNSDALRGSLRRVSPTSLQTGALVLAEYEEDGALYRSVVKHLEGNSVKVEFLDYGNSSVMEDRIFSIPEEFLSQPRFSIPCCLFDNKAYENEAAFTRAAMEKPLLFHFARHPGPQWEVVIVEGATGPSEPPVESKTHSEERGNDPAGLSGTDQALSTVDPEKSTQTPPASLPSRLKRLTCRCCRRPPTRLKRGSRDVRRQTKSLSEEPEGPGAHAVTPLNIQSKTTENCTLLSVTRDGSFYVRLQRSAHLLSALERSIFHNLHRCAPVPAEEVKVGLKCLVQVPKDQRWHRAVVQQVYGQTCLVRLDDHGITEAISAGSVRQRCDLLTEVPDLAVLCRMNSFGFGACRSWLESLQLLVGSEVRLIFMSYSEVGELWKVEMVVNPLFLGLLMSPEKTSDPAASRPQQLNFAPVELDKSYHGFAAAATNPFEFCVLLEESLLVLKKVSVMLSNLPKQLLPLPEAHLLPGTCCLLKSSTKKKWCRAEVVHLGGTIVLLNLLDYGFYECTPRENAGQLRMLPAEMRNLPKVIHPCILRGVRPLGADGQWADEAAFCFQRCLYQKRLQIFFRERVSDSAWKVDMLADGVHVAKWLVDAQQAHYLDIVQEVRFQEWSLGTGNRSKEERDEVYDGFRSYFTEVQRKIPISKSSHCSLM
ncbi:tudor domain-containing protein 15 [Takifugu rubripes]|uniref:tudor domain-containing protein 15 n=1 Tax=Takifugu rubripes TaxID=31033 RepID=UPI001145CD49|nr:tudor domain-containing protein 15 [Takifugu rubripes]